MVINCKHCIRIVIIPYEYYQVVLDETLIRQKLESIKHEVELVFLMAHIKIYASMDCFHFCHPHAKLKTQTENCIRNWCPVIEIH